MKELTKEITQPHEIESVTETFLEILDTKYAPIETAQKNNEEKLKSLQESLKTQTSLCTETAKNKDVVQAELNAALAKISELQAKIQELTNSVTELTKQNALQKKKILALAEAC
jgi:chromosome segregation ATPase